jgi:hypothetical protein
MIIEALTAATLLVQVKDPDLAPDDPAGTAASSDQMGEDGFAGEGGLDAQYEPEPAYNGPRTIVCDFEFQAGRRRPRDLEVSCPAGDLTEEVEARANEVMNWETRRNTDSQLRREPVRGQLVMRRNMRDDGRPLWLADTTLVLGAVPSYPNSQARRAPAATCTIVFHVIDNAAETQGVSCLTGGLADAFERVAGRAVERYVFVGDHDLYCVDTVLAFYGQSGGRLPPPAAPACTPPDEEFAE